MLLLYLAIKMVKMILSIILVLIYCLAVREEAKAFLLTSGKPAANRQSSTNGVNMLRNCFIFILIFLFPFQVHFKREEEPCFVYQIQQIERDKRQQENVRCVSAACSAKDVTAVFGNKNGKDDSFDNSSLDRRNMPFV